MTGFVIRAGHMPATEFYAPYGGATCWTDDRESAFVFDARADAEHVRSALFLADASRELAVMPADRREVQADEARRQHAAGMAAVNAVAEW